MRCKWIYDGWYLHGCIPIALPEQTRKLATEWRRGLFKVTFNGVRVSCNYCAETVAAAKLYALHQGAVTLVLPQDADKVKVATTVGD